MLSRYWIIYVKNGLGRKRKTASNGTLLQTSSYLKRQTTNAECQRIYSRIFWDGQQRWNILKKSDKSRRIKKMSFKKKMLRRKEKVIKRKKKKREKRG